MLKLKLRWKLGLVMAGLIFMLTATLTYFSIQWQKNSWLKDVKEKNLIIANSIKHHTEDFLKDEELSSSEKRHLINFIDSFNQDFVFFRVVGRDGKILTSLDSEETSKQDEDECLVYAIKDRKVIEHVWAFRTKGEEEGEIVESFSFFDRRPRAQEIVMPLFGEGKLLGAIHIYSNLSELAKAIDAVYLRNLLLAFVATLVSFLLYWVALSKFVYRPIDILRGTAQQVAKGDFKKRAKILSKDEFGELFETCNMMTEKLSSLISQLDASQRQAKACVTSVGRALGSSLNERKLSKTILDAATSIMGAERASLMMLDEKKGELVVKAAHDLSEEVIKSTKLKLGDGIAGWVAKRGEPLLLIDGINDPRFKPIYAKEEVKDAIVAPLKVKGKIIGVLNVTNKIGSETFDQDDLELLVAMANEAAMALENSRFYQGIKNNFFGVISALAEAVDAKDMYTRGHSERVTDYAVVVAEEMRLSDFEKERIRVAATLHDIGKIGISEKILLKPGKFTFDEMIIMQTHSLIGANILSPIEFPWDIVSLVRHHHERYDGLGYPGGLAGDEIPLGARILTVADSFEAMVSDRPYHKAKMAVEAMEEVKSGSGSQFSPDVAKAFLSVFEKGKIKIFSNDDLYKDLLAGKEAEKRAVRETFLNIANSLLEQYAKIGGQKMMRNLDIEIKKLVLREELNLKINNGRVEIAEDDHVSFDEEIKVYKKFLSALTSLIKQMTGEHLLSNFLSVSLGNLSDRLKLVANHHSFDCLSGES